MLIIKVFKETMKKQLLIFLYLLGSIHKMVSANVPSPAPSAINTYFTHADLGFQIFAYPMDDAVKTAFQDITVAFLIETKKNVEGIDLQITSVQVTKQILTNDINSGLQPRLLLQEMSTKANTITTATRESPRSCEDNTGIILVTMSSGNISSRDCQWIAKSKENRCSLEGASIECPDTCDQCSAGPTEAPSTAPTRRYHWCEDSDDRFGIDSIDWIKNKKNCEWVKDKIWNRCSYEEAKDNCPVLCDYCNCKDNPGQFVLASGETNTCEWAQRDVVSCNDSRVESNCPLTCGVCDQPISLSPLPTTALPSVSTEANTGLLVGISITATVSSPNEITNDFGFADTVLNGFYKDFTRYGNLLKNDSRMPVVKSGSRSDASSSSSNPDIIIGFGVVGGILIFFVIIVVVMMNKSRIDLNRLVGSNCTFPDEFINQSKMDVDIISTEAMLQELGLSRQLSRQLSQQLPHQLSQQLSQQLSKQLSNQLSKQLSNQLPQQLPQQFVIKNDFSRKWGEI